MAGIYLHIPFCKRRCVYCDFYSTTMESRKDAYIQALCEELKMRREYLNGASVETVYFGGGTPSQLDEVHFEHVFDVINQVYSLSSVPEITLEANPDDLTPMYVNMLRRLPFNRISIGIQTFQDDTLCLLRRRHTAQQAIEAVKRCQDAGFSNISIDLMYGLPKESKESWQADLQQAIALDVPHISAYHLIYEEGTELWNLRRKHQIEEIDEERSVEFFSMLIDTLQAVGYVHYEISNFAKPGMYSRHNSSYWDGTYYLGCGAAAHSYNGISRQWNVASLDTYIENIKSGLLPCEIESLDQYTRYNDKVITSIRTSKGLSLSALQLEFGQRLYNYCLSNADTYLKEGLLTIENGRLHLTRKGIFVSDGIMSDLLWVD